MTLPELIIDLREEHELLESRLISPDGTYEIINIPSRHIFANIGWISKQTEKRPVWFICASGRRSQAIKEHYFGRNDGIKSSEGGLKLLGGNGNGSGTVSVDPSRIEVRVRYRRLRYSTDYANDIRSYAFCHHNSNLLWFETRVFVIDVWSDASRGYRTVGNQELSVRKACPEVRVCL